MANAYYLDFTVTLYTTKTIIAESDEEARRIAEGLSDSYRFFDEHLLPAFRRAEILPENMYMDDDNPGWYVVNMGVDEEAIECERREGRFMEADEINEYLEDE